ncbi:MAG: helix-turn-helix domain-containing protein [Chloroflexota bacterium]
MPFAPGTIDVLSQECPSRQVLQLIADKWTVLVLYALADRTMRHHEILRLIDGISQKMLIQTLRALECDGLVERHAYPEVPPRVEYRLTSLGLSLRQTTTRLCDWAMQHLEEVEEARASHADSPGSGLCRRRVTR